MASSSPNETKPIETDSNANLLKVMYAMDSSMVIAHRKDNDAGRAEAEDTARKLLEYAELPLIRARACMVLACSDAPGFLEHAKEAVRIAQLGIDNATNAGVHEQKLLERCNFVLKEAQEAHDAKVVEEVEGAGTTGVVEMREQDEAEDEDEDEGEVVLIWKDGKPVYVNSFADREGDVEQG